MRKLNLVFLIGLLIALSVFGGASYLVHSHQLQKNASVLLDRAEKEKDLDKAVELLGRYLKIKPDDGRVWALYARLIDRQTSEGRGRAQVYLIYEEALRFNPRDPELERKCAELALGLA